MKRFFTALLFFVASSINAQERITSWVSSMTVLDNGLLQVTEDISVVAEGRSIRHGITREFITRHFDRFGTWFNTTLSIAGVLRDGRSIGYRTQGTRDGYIAYLGTRKTALHPGSYTYTIRYTSMGHIRFFDDHDELYLNVTGNKSIFPIEQLRVFVQLPKDIPNGIQAEAYTAFWGAKDQNYKAQVQSGNVAEFFITKPLLPGQGLTIVLMWPKGYVVPPTWFDWAVRFAQDNMLSIVILFLIVLLFVYYLLVWGLVRPVRTITIPLFEPPRHMSVAEVGYVWHKHFKQGLFPAQLVQYAVQGYLEINYKKYSWVSGAQYELVKKKDDLPRPLERLFEASNIVLLQRGYIPQVAGAVSLLTHKVSRRWKEVIRLYSGHWAFAVAVSIGVCVVAYLLGPPISGIEIMFFVAMLVVHGIGFLLLRQYTSKGKTIVNEIAGFKMFLEATEVNRMKMLNAPEQTPQQYEAFLPYAMVLGVERRWTQQFSSLFKHRAATGKTYHPSWYRGRYFGVRSFSSSFNRSFTTSIRSSGGGGSGSSGGGSGGGGVGGF